MPKLEYFLVAESVSIDRDQNRVSVFNILEEVSIPKSDPKIIPYLVAFSSWIIAPEDQGKDFQVSVELAGPNLDRTLVFPVNFTANGNRQRTRVGISGMPIERTGDTVFSLKLNGEQTASHNLTIRPSDEGSV